MNKERILQLADVLEKGYHHFNGVKAVLNMNFWLNNRDFLGDDKIPWARKDIVGQEENVMACNTICCMAGFACLLFDYENASKSLAEGDEHYEHYSPSTTAAELLGLDFLEKNELFKTNVSDEITGPQAAAVLRNFAETGEIDWWTVRYGSKAVD